MLQFCGDLVLWPLTEPVTWFGNYCLAMILLCAACALVGRVRIGAGLTSLTLGSLAFASRTKLLAINEPLFPRDLALVRFAFQYILSQLSFRGWLLIVGVTTAIVLLIIRQALARKRACAKQARPLPKSGRICMAVAALLVLVLYHFLPVPGVRPLIAMENQRVGQRSMMGPAYYAWYYHRGFLLAFVQYCSQSTYSAPPGYSQETMAQIAKSCEVGGQSSEAALIKPSVIVWLSESFWDPTLLPGVKVTPDPLANYRHIAQEGRRIPLVVPVFGGGSSHTELEMALGVSYAYIPIGFGGFNELFDKPMPSIARVFAARGYETVALCAGLGDLFNETRAFPLLGFKEYRYVASSEWDPKMPIGLSDAAFTDRVIDYIERAQSPVFMFAATVQGHAPYVPGLYTRYDVEVRSDLAAESAATLRVYCQSMYEADQALAKLVNHFRGAGKPVVILFYGDHLPPLGSIYSEPGYLAPTSEDPEPDRRLRKYTTAALLWTNTNIPLPNVAGPQSPAIVVSSLMQSMGIHHPFYTGFLPRVAALTPVISPHVTVTADGKAHATPPNNHVLDQYNLMCYDLLFGKRYTVPTMFRECPQEQ